jgi:hypothetical protein
MKLKAADQMTAEDWKEHFAGCKKEHEAALRPAAETKPASKRASRSRSKFTKFPEEWRDQLARMGADGTTYRVALYLLYEVWRSGSDRVKLANVGLKAQGVSRWGKNRALHRLARAGLISTERASGKSPVVTVKYTA